MKEEPQLKASFDTLIKPGIEPVSPGYKTSSISKLEADTMS